MVEAARGTRCERKAKPGGLSDHARVGAGERQTKSSSKPTQQAFELSSKLQGEDGGA